MFPYVRMSRLHKRGTSLALFSYQAEKGSRFLQTYSKYRSRVECFLWVAHGQSQLRPSTADLELEVFEHRIYVGVTVQGCRRHPVAVGAESDARDGSRGVCQCVHHAEGLFHTWFDDKARV